MSSSPGYETARRMNRTLEIEKGNQKEKEKEKQKGKKWRRKAKARRNNVSYNRVAEW